MKKISTTIVIALLFMTHACTYAQNNSKITTVIINFEGKSDRPFPAILVSTTTEEAEWYRNRLFGDVGPLVTQITIVREQMLADIAEILRSKSIQYETPATDKQLPFPRLMIILGQGHDYTEGRVSSDDGLVLIGEIKQHVSQYPNLVEKISDVEKRIKVQQSR